MDRINRTGTGIASLGRNEDQFLAHVALGERVVPPVISAATQARINKEMRAAGLDPNEYAVGSGMSINPITGLPEFGFFKKAFKSIKKVARKAAPVLQFVPGPIGAVAGTINKITTVADVARGKASPLNLLTLGKGTGGLESLGGEKGNIFTNIFRGTPGINPSAEGGLGGLFSRAKEFILPGEDKVGLFGNIGKGVGSLFGGMGGLQPYTDAEIDEMLETMNPDMVQQIVNERNALISQSKPQFSGLFGPDSIADKLFNVDPNKGTGPLSFLGKGAQQSADFLGGLGGGLGGGLASAGLGGFLGKLAYDAAKDRAGGLAVTPQVSMDALGRYQLASDLGTGGTRGQFGLAPKPAVLDVAGMGRQAFAEGGIAELDLREGGESIGPGTGTSDDIPAMLSDGEFVMTAKATRGAGAFDLKKGKSGIELISGGSSSREKGVENMRELMNIFEGV